MDSKEQTQVDTPKQTIIHTDAAAPETSPGTDAVSEISTAPPNTEDSADYNNIEPRGAYAFVLALGLVYIVYWFVSYFEIFIIRGN